MGYPSDRRSGVTQVLTLENGVEQIQADLIAKLQELEQTPIAYRVVPQT